MAKAFAKGIYSEKKSVKICDALPKFEPKNAQVFFEIEIGWAIGAEGNPKGRVVFELFTTQVPKTATAFMNLATDPNSDTNHK